MEYPRYGIGLGELPTREAGIFQNPRYLIRNRVARQSPSQNIPYHRLSPEAAPCSWLMSSIPNHNFTLSALSMPEQHPKGHLRARCVTKRTDNCHRKAEYNIQNFRAFIAYFPDGISLLRNTKNRRPTVFLKGNSTVRFSDALGRPVDFEQREPCFSLRSRIRTDPGGCTPYVLVSVRPTSWWVYALRLGECAPHVSTGLHCLTYSTRSVVCSPFHAMFLAVLSLPVYSPRFPSLCLHHLLQPLLPAFISPSALYPQIRPELTYTPGYHS